MTECVQRHDDTSLTWSARQKKIERLMWPITAAYMLCGVICVSLLFVWRDGNVEMTFYLAVTTASLGIVAALLLVGQRWVENALYEAMPIVAEPSPYAHLDGDEWLARIEADQRAASRRTWLWIGGGGGVLIALHIIVYAYAVLT
jgi:hypothetical protein